MKTAVVVDDDIDTVEIFSSLLEEKDVKVVGKGHNGREAVDLYNEKKPDVIFVDIMMPDGNGIYAIRKIKEQNQNAKIVAVTADVSSLTLEKLKKLNTPIVYKPFEINKILQIIEN